MERSEAEVRRLVNDLWAVISDPDPEESEVGRVTDGLARNGVVVRIKDYKRLPHSCPMCNGCTVDGYCEECDFDWEAE